jgi:hypothetical protein
MRRSWRIALRAVKHVTHLKIRVRGHKDSRNTLQYRRSSPKDAVKAFSLPLLASSSYIKFTPCILLPFPEEWGFIAPLQTIKTPVRQFWHVSNIKPISFLIVLLLLILQGSAQKAEQICKGDDCVQVALNTGVINIEGGKVQIAINNGVVNITYVGDPKDKVKIENYDVTNQFISKTA